MIQKAHLKKWLFPILLLVATLILPNAAVFGSDDPVVLLESDADAKYSVKVMPTSKSDMDLAGFTFTLYRIGDVELTPLALKLDSSLEAEIGIDSARLNDLILYDSQASDEEKESKRKIAQIIARRLSRAPSIENMAKSSVGIEGSEIVIGELGPGLYLFASSSTDGKYASEPTLFTLPYFGEDGKQDQFEIYPKIEEVERDNKVTIHKVLTNDAGPTDGFLYTKTYEFGLFAEDLETTVKDLGLSALDIEAKARVSVRAGSGEGTAEITGLAPGTYWIYELDDNGLPILDYKGSTDFGDPEHNYIISIDHKTGNTFTLDKDTKEITIEAWNRYHLGMLYLKKILKPDFVGSSDLEFEVQVIRTVGDEVTEYESIMVPANGEPKKIMVDLEADRATGQEVTYSIREIVDPSEDDPRQYIVAYSGDCVITKDETKIGDEVAEDPDRISLTVTNTLRTEITVEKDLFQYSKADGVNPVGTKGKDLTYEIGLFEGEVTAESKPLRTDKVVVVDGKADGRVVFENLEAGKTYSIFELDADGKPIMGSEINEDGSLKESEDSESEAVSIEGPEDLDYYYTRYLIVNGEDRTDGNSITTDHTRSKYEVEVYNVYEGEEEPEAVLYLKKTVVGGDATDREKDFYVDIYRQDLEAEGAQEEFVKTVTVPGDGTEVSVILEDETLKHRVLYTAKERAGADGDVIEFGSYWNDGDRIYTVTAGQNPRGVELNSTTSNNKGNAIEIINTVSNLTIEKKIKHLVNGDDGKTSWEDRTLKSETFYVGLFEEKVDAEHLVGEPQALTFKGTNSAKATLVMAKPDGKYILAEVKKEDGKWVPVTGSQEYTGAQTDLEGYTFEPVFVDGDKTASTLEITFDPLNPEIEFENRFTPPTPPEPPMEGHITITKNVICPKGNIRQNPTGTFYAGIYLDKEYKTPAPTKGSNKRVAENPVKLDLSKSASATIDVSLYETDRDEKGVASVTLYVTEVTQEGSKYVPVKDAKSFNYTVTYGSERKASNGVEVKISQGDTKEVVINNQEPPISCTPPCTQPPCVTCPPGSPNGGGGYSYNSNGGYAVTQETVGTTSRVAVVTGDDTPIGLYVGLLAAAGILMTALVVKRRKSC